jgi:hypothetical protein
MSMTDTMSRIGSAYRTPAPDDALARAPVLHVGIIDIVVALVTLELSAGILCGILSLGLGVGVALLLHLVVLALPGVLVATRWHEGGELTLPVLLLLATFVAGPLGAAGCTVMALALRCQQPSPERLKGWYDYISGLVTRSRLTRIHDDLISNRLPSDLDSEVPRFARILAGTSLDDQQRVLGVVGRSYAGDFRPILKRALRNRSGLIRAQAAAIASSLDLEEKTKLWSSGALPETAALPAPQAAFLRLPAPARSD